MEEQISALHSHSGIEKELKMPKREVLVDEKFEKAFFGHILRRLTYKDKEFLVVPTLVFVRKGGLFKAYSE